MRPFAAETGGQAIRFSDIENVALECRGQVDSSNCSGSAQDCEYRNRAKTGTWNNLSLRLPTHDFVPNLYQCPSIVGILADRRINNLRVFNTADRFNSRRLHHSFSLKSSPHPPEDQPSRHI